MRSVSLGYFNVPKCASTSIGHALHQEEFGIAFDDRQRSIAKGGLQNIHGFMRKRFLGDISMAQHRLIVVRDPVARFLSGYGSRVTGHLELSRAKVEARYKNDHDLSAEGFIFNPGLGQFLENFERYMQETPIEWHLRLITEHLPQGLDQFTRVYPMKELDLFQAHLSEIYGKDVHLPRLQTKGQHASIKQLSSSQLEQIIDYCQPDYELLEQWFSPDKAWHQWRNGKFGWVYQSVARRLEDGLRLSRTPTELLSPNVDGKKIAYVTSGDLTKRPIPSILLNRALRDAGGVQSYFALASPENEFSESDVAIDNCSWKILSSTSSAWALRLWQHFVSLRSALASADPDLVHCYGLRSAMLVNMSLFLKGSRAAMIVEIPEITSASRRFFHVTRQRINILLSRLLCAGRRASVLLKLSNEDDRKLYEKYQDKREVSAHFVPVIDENKIHLSVIDSSCHGVVFFNASGLRLNETSDAKHLLTKLINELGMTEAWSYLKILMPVDPTVEQALLVGGLKKQMSSSQVKIIDADASSLAEIQSSQVVIVPSLCSMQLRQFAVEAQQRGRPVVAPKTAMEQPL